MANVIPKLSTFLFNNLQLGIIIIVIRYGLPLEYAFLFYLVFEIVILIDCIIKFGSQRFWAFLLLSASFIQMFVLNESLSHSGPLTLALSCTSLAICIVSLKKIRTINNAVGDVKKKWRAYGYLTAFFFSPYLMFSCAAIIFLLSLNSENISESANIQLPSASKQTILPYSCIMVHHLHYFAYAYIIPIIVHKYSDMPLILLGPVFFIGWAGYYFFDKTRKHQLAFVFVGHVVSSFAVLGLLFFTNTSIVLSLWFVTGVGAGTIILLRDYYTKSNPVMYEQFKIWESFGHIGGILSFGAAIMLHSYQIAFIISFISGLLCSLIAIILRLKELHLKSNIE